jgi:phosphonate transport system permease protein
MGLLLYLLHPLTSRSMLTYTLMRAECAVRNASVIGAVGGGGLGGQMLEEFATGNERSALTLLFFLLALTGGADLLTNFVRNRLREDPNHVKPQDLSIERTRRARRAVLGGLALAALGSAAWLRGPLLRAVDEMQRVEWGFIGEHFGGLLRPDLSSEALASALAGLPVPLALGWLGTVLGTALAALLSWPASVAFQIDPARFTGERAGALARAGRAALLVGSRTAALVMRAIPEVAWLLILAALFKVGPLPGVLALSIHSAGVLGRVYTESVDNLPYRNLEPAALGGRAGAFLYAALPLVRHDWVTYAFFQLESNVRTGVLLGILGLGGLGNSFHTAFGLAQMGRASTYLIGMVVITIALDRVSRALHFTRGPVS